VQLISSGPHTESEVLRFARALRLRPLPASPAPFALATAPIRLVLQHMSKDFVCLAPPTTISDRSGRGICISLSPSADNPLDPQGEQLSVGGHRATLSKDGDDRPEQLIVALDGSRNLVVGVAQDDVPLTRERLIRLAEGITVR
jgi:hypothetical protein